MDAAELVEGEVVVARLWWLAQPLGVAWLRWEVVGNARPAITDDVGRGETFSANPCIAIIPFDAIGLKVGADDELADGVSAIFVEMANPVAESAVGAEEAEAVVRCVGNVTCNAHEQHGVAVRAPETVDADVVAPAIDSIGVAGDGRNDEWRSWGALDVLASAG